MGKAADNYFSIPNPENMFCRVWQYRYSLLKLIIHQGDGQALYSLVFTPTYFLCPREWKGASFRLGTLEEHLELWQSLDIDMSKDDFRQHLTLFIVEADADLPNPKTVRILATKAEVHEVKR